ncbi:MAG: LuxR family transcriptional regulator [Roseivivax sp.]|nr:LuxR family transcriptional regulator [Roseivivax sp.]
MTPLQRAYLIDMTNAGNVETIWKMHCHTMANYGFDRLLYGFTRFITPHSLGDPKDFMMLTNFDRGYTDGFVSQGLYHHAPMVRWALENDGFCSWSVLGQMAAQGAMTQAERKVMEFNIAHGVSVGYTISFRSVSSRAKGAIALVAKPGMTQDEADAVWARHGENLVLMNNLLHLKLLTLPYTPPHQVLTKRQREALEWVGDGKTTQDIAQLMGLTTATVEKHLRLAREALNVETTAQAVLKAAFMNQMFLVDA